MAAKDLTEATSARRDLSKALEEAERLDEEERDQIYDIKVGDEKVGEVPNRNQVVIETDKECAKVLKQLRKLKNLKASENRLLKRCMKAARASDEDDIDFGPVDFFNLTIMALNHPEISQELMAISHHILSSIDMEGEVPPEAMLKMAALHGELGDGFVKSNDGEEHESDEEIDTAYVEEEVEEGEEEEVEEGEEEEQEDESDSEEEMESLEEAKPVELPDLVDDLPTTKNKE